jgi:excinuclease UvrABC ATPase subunit
LPVVSTSSTSHASSGASAISIGDSSLTIIAYLSAIVAWIYKCLPGVGHDGGRIVIEGTPAGLVTARSTLAGEHLAAYVGR